MYILGIHDGHNSGATLAKDGIAIASVCEERLTRVKNEIGFPALSIVDVLKTAGISAEQVDRFVFASNYMHTAEHLRNAEQWYTARTTDQDVAKPTQEDLSNALRTRTSERIQQLVQLVGCSTERISFYDHHECHAATAYYGSHYSFSEKVLVLTCDGSGDGLSATVSIGEHGRMTRIAATGRDASLGKIYSRVTFSLGLKPWEHEYKVMGLAPYAYQEKARDLSAIYQELLCVDEASLQFKNVGGKSTNYIYDFLREKFERKRFDEIAASIQLFTEDVLLKWVEACIRRTGIRKIACGGGVFMNVKANMKLSQLPDVDDMYVFPSCGDESLSFGAAWLSYYGNVENPSHKPDLLPNLYLGREFSASEIAKAIDSDKNCQAYNIQTVHNIEEVIAEKLANNLVVARCSGRMEWGARALGNRSILANPSSWANVEKINAMIKMRDFWMPFAPSMLEDRQEQLIANPKGIKSPFMMFAFETTADAKKRIPAAIHPRDRSARAQFVSERSNPGYYRLIESFREKTGTPAVLNTSFNLHGYPLVYTPEDALDVFNRSGLDCLALDNTIITKSTH